MPKSIIVDGSGTALGVEAGVGVELLLVTVQAEM